MKKPISSLFFQLTNQWGRNCKECATLHLLLSRAVGVDCSRFSATFFLWNYLSGAVAGSYFTQPHITPTSSPILFFFKMGNDIELGCQACHAINLVRQPHLFCTWCECGVCLIFLFFSFYILIFLFALFVLIINFVNFGGHSFFCPTNLSKIYILW